MKTLTLILSILFSTILYSQTVPPAKKKNELGTKLYSYSITQSYFDSDVELQHQFVNGIQYKRVLPKNFALRTLLTFAEKNRSMSGSYHMIQDIDANSIPPEGFYSNSTKDQSIELFMGVEKRWKIGKLAPYIFTDFWSNYVMTKTSSVWVSNSSDNQTEMSYNNDSYILGIGIGSGLKYDITQHLYLSVETSFLSGHIYYDDSDNYRHNFNPVSAVTFGVKF